MRTLLSLSLGVAVALGGVREAGALATAFTYQGRLTKAGAPANGLCDFQFGLFTAESGGMQLGLTEVLDEWPVANGLFTVQLNAGGEFGAAAFDGGDRFLEIATRCPAGTGSFAPLAPRQLVTVTPYATYADRVTNVRTFLFENTALGLDALVSNTDGTYNTAVGEKALQLNTLGYLNTAVGAEALRANINGHHNTALGGSTLSYNETGAGNTAVGLAALYLNVEGSDNTAVGYGALNQQTTGFSNTAVGKQALGVSEGTIGNTAVGSTALANTTGNNNIGLGVSAGVSLTTGNDNIYIGNYGTIEDGAIRIGWSVYQKRTFIAGISGVGVTGTPVYVNSDGQLGVVLSSARFKEDIEDMGDASDDLLRLRPVRFRYKRDLEPSGAEQYGLVAEEVARVSPDLVSYDTEGRPETVRYQFVNAMLLNEVQKQARQLDAQALQLAEQRRRMEEQTKQVAALTGRLLQVEETLGAAACSRACPVSHRAKTGL